MLRYLDKIITFMSYKSNVIMQNTYEIFTYIFGNMANYFLPLSLSNPFKRKCKKYFICESLFNNKLKMHKTFIEVSNK